MSSPAGTTPQGRTARSGIDVDGLELAVRPQDDLFGHVNGVWLATTEIPADRAIDGAFPHLRDKSEADLRVILEELRDGADHSDPAQAVDAGRLAGDLYASFMDEDRIEQLGTGPLQPLLARVDAVADLPGLAGVLGELNRLGVPGLFGWWVDTDAKASDRYIVNLVQGGLGLPDESYYHDEAFAPVRAAYAGHLERVLDLAALPEPVERAALVLRVEHLLADQHWTRVESRDVSRTYNKHTFAELVELVPSFDWRAWLTGLQAPDGVLAEVVVRQLSYFTALETALRQVPLEEWKAWLSWHVVRAASPYLSAEFSTAHFEFYGRTLTGAQQQRERWKRGVELVEGTVGDALGQVYVARHFPPAAKARITELVQNLVAAYREDISALDWMGPETRERALEKLAKFTPKVGYPDQWKDYSGLVVDRADLLGNVQRANAHETDRELGKIGSPVDRGEWFMTPQTVNAYYNPGMNEIVFPAAILQPPFFDAEADDAANYGGIGAVIGHEIGHGFDDQGSKYDGDGNLADWWTDEDRVRFEERANALIAQYDTFEPREAPGHRVNGAFTVGENIGDLGGLTVAHRAYRISLGGQDAPVIDGLTGDQRFFMGWAQVWATKTREAEAVRRLSIDPHAPGEFRCNVVRNLDEFYAAFDVVEGDGLWLAPDQRVRIW